MRHSWAVLPHNQGHEEVLPAEVRPSPRGLCVVLPQMQCADTRTARGKARGRARRINALICHASLHDRMLLKHKQLTGCGFWRFQIPLFQYISVQTSVFREVKRTSAVRPTHRFTLAQPGCNGILKRLQKPSSCHQDHLHNEYITQHTSPGVIRAPVALPCITDIIEGSMLITCQCFGGFNPPASALDAVRGGGRGKVCPQHVFN